MTIHRLTEYTPKQLHLVTYLQQLLWEGGPTRNAAYLDWKYGQNPYLDYRYIVLAWAGDELVGMIGAFGACWETTTGHRMMLPCLADTVLKPSLRGSSLFGDMIGKLSERLHLDGVPWLLDFGDQPAGPIMLMRGWKAIGPWPVATAKRQTILHSHEFWNDRRQCPIPGKRSGMPIQPLLGARPHAMSALVERLPPANGVSHVRNAEYVTWRSRNPLARYFYLASGALTLDGYLVAHRSMVDNDDGPTPTTIVECEAMSDDLWMDLLEVALDRLPGSVLLMWARDISPARKAGLGQHSLELDEPTGRLSKDKHLPNLLVCSTKPLGDSSPFAGLDSPLAWDLRGICGRSWR